MTGMFGFLDMMGNHESRKVAQFEEGDLFVDTCAVSDSDQPYETAIAYPRYNDGKLVIVELYPTKEAAQQGHDKWVKTMTADILPERLVDVSTCTIAELSSAVGGDGWRQFEKEKG